MRYATGLLVIGLLAISSAASAGEFSGTVTAVSDYDFRGVSLSATDPALQGSFDFAADNGFYAGVWASNIDYGSSIDGDIEVDYYLGFAGETGSGVSWDVGVVDYTYPGSSISLTKDKIHDYPEFYGSVGYKYFTFKQWYTDDYGGSGLDGLYSELNASFELPSEFTLNLHTGYNYGDIFDGFEFMDYSVGVGRTVGHFDMELKLTGTDLSGADKITDDVFNTEARVLFSISTTFPWGGE